MGKTGISRVFVMKRINSYTKEKQYSVEQSCRVGAQEKNFRSLRIGSYLETELHHRCRAEPHRRDALAFAMELSHMVP